jgi:hypothetical protein
MTSQTTQSAVFQATVTAQYEVRDFPDGPSALPWQRADVWKFATQGVSVPALYYIDGQEIKPLVNSANDYFEGLMVDEAQQKVTITGNRLAFPSALAASITNCVNAGPYLGFPARHVKVQGISGEYVSETVDEQTYFFWKITSELLCRQTGWDLLLPDIGFNYIEGGQKKRAIVKGPEGEDIASTNAVALNGSGGLAGAGNLPAVLTRQIYREIPMTQFFGTPPS